MTATDRAIELVTVAAQAASDKLAENIVAFDVSEQLVITDAFVLCSASNDRQVKSIVDEVEDKLREAGAKPIRREGERDGRWVLIDYGEIVVHVQHEEERVFYALERIWRDCPTIKLPETVSSGRGGDGDGDTATSTYLMQLVPKSERPQTPRAAAAWSHRVEPDRTSPRACRRPARRGRPASRQPQQPDTSSPTKPPSSGPAT